MQSFDWSGTLNYEKNLLKFSGFYSELKSKENLYYYIRKIFFIVTTVFFELLLIISLFEAPNIIQLTKSLILFIIETSFLIKFVILLYHLKELIIIEDIMKDFSSYPLAMSELNRVNYTLKSMTSFSKVYRGNCLFACCIQTIPPLIKNVKYALPTSIHIPYNIANNGVYIMTFIYQVILVLISAHLNTLIDIIYTKLVTLVTCLFEVLMERLNNIGCIMDMEDEQHFRQCLIFQNKILRFVDVIEQIYCYITFSQLAGSVAVICFAAFGIIIVPVGSGDFGVNVMFFINMVTQVALYCWYGHNMRALSIDLNNACYMSNWYNTNKRVKKMLIIFMERSKIPVFLTAGKLFPLTLTTLTSILRSSYSYFAVLLQIYSDK